jgi:hypothetical protein
MGVQENNQAAAKHMEALYRVDDVLQTLKEYWMAHPYLRLAQIVSNAWRVHPDYKRNPEPDINDVFYLEDSKFLEGLKLLQENESEDKRTTES